METQVDFAAARQAAEREGVIGGGGDYYKYKDGDNRVRLLSVCLPHKGTFQGKPNFKWLCYVLDRRDGSVKVHFMPHKVYKQIEALQVSEDYAFTSVPMPYDITIRAKGAGTKEVEYTVIPARKETKLTEDEIELLTAAKSIQEVKDALDKKAGAPEPPQAHGHMDEAATLDDSDIPF